MTVEKNIDFRTVWKNCLEVIRDNVDETSFNTWFKPIVPIKLTNYILTIQVPSHLFYEWLEEHYINLLKKTIKKELGPEGQLQYSVIMEKKSKNESPATFTLPTNNRKAVSNLPVQAPIDFSSGSTKELLNPFVLPGLKKRNIPTNLIDTLNFDTFIEGDCNRLARSAGWAIAKDPGETAFNPLFVYSDVGLGKTHLAHAIGIQTKINHPDKTVLYVSSEIFCQQYLEASRNKNINDFIYFYQMIDVLIIDDIQFLHSKEKTQEAFFQIFNHLHQKKKQLILTSDKSPVEISGFEPRLLNRFKWGLTADLQIPALETRIAILNNKLLHSGIDFPKEVVDYLALRVTSNVRELEGALIAILAQASLNRKEITVDLAKQMVDKYVKSTAKEISIEYVQKVVCDYFNISVEQINAKTRKREIVQARQLSMFFAKKHTKLALSTIGDYCGKKDHATVLHACRTITNLYETDKQFKICVDEIEKRLKI